MGHAGEGAQTTEGLQVGTRANEARASLRPVGKGPGVRVHNPIGATPLTVSPPVCALIRYELAQVGGAAGRACMRAAHLVARVRRSSDHRDEMATYPDGYFEESVVLVRVRASATLQCQWL